MNVLSLFDGISCARVALSNLGFRNINYFASEVDEYAIGMSKKNYKSIIRLGDVRDVKADDLPPIDLLIGGSPCQDLSVAGLGAGLNGERSKLFFEYVRLLKELKPKYFLLENVRSKWREQMSEHIGVDYVKVNSNVMSAQSRLRLYWTNIKYEPFPTNFEGTPMIRDIFLYDVESKYYFYRHGLYEYVRNVEFRDKVSINGIKILFVIPRDIYKSFKAQRRIYSLDSKSPTLISRGEYPHIFDGNKIRKLTPLEFERLQTLPDNYTEGFSNRQRYKAIGNGFTVKVIEHFLKGIKKADPKVYS